MVQFRPVGDAAGVDYGAVLSRDGGHDAHASAVLIVQPSCPRLVHRPAVGDFDSENAASAGHSQNSRWQCMADGVGDQFGDEQEGIADDLR